MIQKKNKKSLTTEQRCVIIKTQRKQKQILIKKENDTMTNKMTYVKALEIAMKAVEDNKEVTEKLEALKESISKKNSAERKPTATQKANEEYKKAILSFMEVGKKYTISELMKEVVELADLSNQRVSALVRQLKDSGLVERTEEKRKAYFSKKAVTENEGE